MSEHPLPGLNPGEAFYPCGPTVYDDQPDGEDEMELEGELPSTGTSPLASAVACG